MPAPAIGAATWPWSRDGGPIPCACSGVARHTRDHTNAPSPPPPPNPTHTHPPTQIPTQSRQVVPGPGAVLGPASRNNGRLGSPPARSRPLVSPWAYEAPLEFSSLGCHLDRILTALSRSVAVLTGYYCCESQPMVCSL